MRSPWIRLRQLLGSTKRGRTITRRQSRTQPYLERLEDRTLLNGSVPVEIHPTYVKGPDSGSSPSSSPSSSPDNSGPYGPWDVRHAYGVDRVAFGDWDHTMIYGDGTGETIGIVDAYSDPNIASDLAYFDSFWGLAAPPSLTIVNQSGGSSLPSANAGWAQEIAIDVEYAHAMAPGANILLVEANDNSDGNLYAAAEYAGAHANVVTMSFGRGENGNDTGDDSDFTHAGTTFFASTGDGGAPGGYPAYSPNVVAVGGTSLYLDSNGNYSSESGWSGSGGGYSSYESEPSYQYTVQSSGVRTIPDISMLADPNTGVWVYNTYQSGGWGVWGGTSLASPLTAGVSAIVDQGDQYLFGQSSYSGGNYLDALYNLPQTDLNDPISGYNGYYAGYGYDLVTGRGTPMVDRFVSGMDGAPVYNPITGELLVTGGAHNSNDTINIIQDGSYLEIQINSSIPLPGSGVPSSQTFYYSSGQYSSVTVCTSDGSGSTTVNIGAGTYIPINIESHDTTTVNVGTSSSPASNTVNVWETSGGPLTINGSTNMTVNVGENGSLQHIQYYVMIDNPPSFTSVNVDDSADTANQTVYSGLLYNYNSANWQYVGIGGSYVYTKVGDTNYLQVFTGSGTDTVNVFATSVPLYLYNEGGQDYVYVGSNGSSLNGTMANINSYVDVSGYGSTWLYLDDSGDSAGQTVSMYDGTVYYGASAPVSYAPTAYSTGGVVYLAVYGGYGGNTFWVYNTSNLYNGTYLSSGSGYNYVNVEGTSGFLDVDGDSGVQSVYVGSNGYYLGGTLANIQAGIYVYNSSSSGYSYLYVDDSGDSSGQTMSMNFDDITDTAMPGYIDWETYGSGDGGVTDLSIYGGSGFNTYYVNSTGYSPWSYYTTLNTGTGGANVYVYNTLGALNIDNEGGTDGVFVGSDGTNSDSTMANINGYVYAYGSGATYMYLTDTGDTTGRTVSMYDGEIDGLAPASIYWSDNSSGSPDGGVYSLAIYGGSGGNTFNVYNTSPFYSSTYLNSGSGFNYVNISGTTGFLNVDGGSGGQQVTVGSNGTVQGINGGVDVYNSSSSGYSTMYVYDYSDTASRTVSMYDGAIYGLAPAVIEWSHNSPSTYTGGVYYLLVEGSSGGSTYNVYNTSPFYDETDLYTGSGNDAVNVQGTTGGLYIYNLGGSDTDTIGSLAPSLGGKLSNINGWVEAYGSGSTALVVDDSGDTTSRTATITNYYVSGLGNAGTIYYGGGVTSLTVDGSKAGSTYNIQSTASSTPVTLNGGAGSDTFNVGLSNSLSGILGALTVNGGSGTNTLNVNDSSGGTGLSYTLSKTTLTRMSAAAINFSALTTMNVTAGGSDTLTISNIPGVPTITTNFNGGSGTNTLVGANTTNTWTISAANAGKLNSVNFSNFQNLTGGTGNDTFKFTTNTASVSSISGGGGTTNELDYANSAAVTVTLSSLSAGSATGVGGFSGISTLVGSSNTSNTLIGPNSYNFWTISGGNKGTVQVNGFSGTKFTFSNMPHLVGSSNVDVFKLSSASASSELSINGGGGGDWLNYSGFGTNAVTVNLGNGSASKINGGAAGAVTNIQNVIGASGGTNTLTGNSTGNILIGGTGSNTIVGGSGNSLLIGGGGSGHGSINGNGNEDILIAGSTTYSLTTQAGLNSLMAILAELQSSDTFAQKVSDIINGNASGGGSDLNHANKLKWGGTGATVHASTGAFNLTRNPSAAADWFFSQSPSTISGFVTGVDEHNNNAIGVP